MNYSISAKKNAYIFIIIVGILNTIIAFLMYSYFKQSLTESLYKKNIEIAKLEFTKTEKEIIKKINHYKLILQHIKDSTHFNKLLLDNTNLSNKNLLIHDFETFTQTNKNIFQFRYLDEQGFEKIRIDKVEGKTIITKELQNKSDRYYFKKTKLLKNNQYYISDFDLNVENKKIEIPFKPTIRVSTPIYINEIFKGIVIINYNADELINYITDQRIFNVYYMDSKENFLLHPDKNKCWSTQLNTNFKVKDEIKNIDTLLKNKFEDRNHIYYINKVSITDNDFFIIYSIKKQFYERELRELKNKIVIIFFIIFLVTLPIVVIGSYLQTFQMKILETLIDSLPFPIVLKDNKGNFILLNKSLARLYGHSSKESLLGENSYKFYKKNLPYSDKQIDLEVLSKKKIKFEDSFTLPNDKKLYFDTRLIKISFLGLLKKDFILGIAIDITELKQLNKDLEKKVQEEVTNRLLMEEKLSKKLKQAQVGNLIDNIILQWEYPLNLISLSVQSLEIDSETNNITADKLTKNLDIIKENTNYIYNTAEDFKIFLSTEKGVELFNVNKTIIIIERILKNRFLKDNISIEKNIDKTINIKGQKSEFAQVILNIINNSLDEFELSNKKFDEKKISIEILQKKDFCNIKIKDTAGGIDSKYLNKIFENNFTLKEKDSSGMGLSISKDIILKEFKGEIKVYNEKLGVVTEINLPYKQII
ncbi:PAS domain-containing sensor histidine kinase [Halarcobacter sp.]|uniref:PAS domain-containing sensor histidine kinase n=1 Tax=Halarcobacter sp. TaxID=2321133 RepID=UPI0029F48D3A|nr:PAS domain-containing sensor histidine kinase [Halarcobacter sp.]